MRIAGICSFLALSAIAITAAAQSTPDVAKGLTPYAAYVPNEIDNYNPVNGNIFLKIPLLGYPQRGGKLHLNYFIYSNDKQWNLIGQQAISYSSPITITNGGYWDVQNPELGWSDGEGTYGNVNTPQIPYIGAYVGTDLDIQTGSDYAQWTGLYGDDADRIFISTLMYSYFAMTPDGSKHYIGEYYGQGCSQQGSGVCPPMSSQDKVYYPATDASGYIPTTTGGGLPTITSISDPSGLKYTFPGTYLETVADLTGQNSITMNASGWTDTYGRSLPGSFTGAGTVPFPDDTTPFSIGRVPGIDTGVGSTPCPSAATAARSFVVPGSSSYGGGTETYYFCYQNFSYSTNFNVSGVYPAGGGIVCTASEASSTGANSRGPAQLLTAVVLPDGNSYTFNYDSYLSLTYLGLPTGGSISYQWQNVPFNNCQQSTPISRALKSRTVNPGNGQPSMTTTYQWPLNTPNNATWTPTFPLYSIATDGNGNDTEYRIGGKDDGGNSWGYALTEEDSYQGCGPHDTSGSRTCSPTSGKRLQAKTYTIGYAQSGGAAAGTGGSPNPVPFQVPFTQRIATKTHIATSAGDIISAQSNTYAPGWGSCTLYSYPATMPGQHESGVVTGAQPYAPPTYSNPYSNCFLSNQVASTSYYDYGTPGSGSAGPLIKTDWTNYQWQSALSYQNANLFGLVQMRRTTDGAGNWAAESDFCYDDGSGSVVGNLTATQRLLNATGVETCSSSNSSNSAVLVSKTTYTSAGVVSTTTDPRGKTTSVNTFLCNSALPGQMTLPNGYHVTYSYDCNTGKPVSFLDQNGQLTSYTYNDSLSRPTSISYPDGGSLQVNYNNDSIPLTMTVTTATGEAAGPMVKTMIYDGLVRQTKSQIQESTGSSIYSDTAYDKVGQIATVSNPYRSTSDTTYGRTSFTYDGIGRKTLEANPYGTLQWCYGAMATNGQTNCNSRISAVTGAWIDSADENTNDWQRTTDALGRLKVVMEPSASGGVPSMETDYNYDSLGDLLTISQFGGPTTSAGARFRNFSYDSLGRLITSTNPETGAICYGTWSGGSVGSGTCQNGYD